MGARLIRIFWFGACLIVATALAMSLSYALVRAWTRENGAAQGPGEQVRVQAARLQEASNDLVLLTAEYLDRFKDKNKEEDLGQWIETDFMPELRGLRTRIVSMEGPEKPLSALLAAIDRASAMASYPYRADLRASATDAILDASTETENYLASLRLPGQIRQDEDE